MKVISGLISSALLVLASISVAQATQIKVTITNNAPDGGVALTPVWVGFHNGSFNTFNSGESASNELESLAEDGNASKIAAVFGAGGTLEQSNITPSGERVQGSVGGAPITAGSSASAIFNLSGNLSNQYFSFAGMVLPSSDYFIANNNPLEYSLLSLFENGGSLSFDIFAVNDAGTEVNDFLTAAGNGLFSGLPPMQGGPNVGVDENGVIHDVLDPYASFLNAPGNFDLSHFNFNSSALYPRGLATITISAQPVPESASILLMSLGLLGMVSVVRRRGVTI